MFDLVLAICKIAATSVATKTAAILLDLVGPGGEDEDLGERAAGQPQFGPLGFIARPLAPTTVEGKPAYAEAVAVRTGDGLIPIAYRDLRINALYPSPAEGTIAFVGYTGSFVRQGMDGRVSIYTTENMTPSGRPVFYNVQPDAFVWEAPFGRARFDAKGFHVKEHGGARLDIGSLGMPSPLDALSSYATLQAATVNLIGSLVSLGPNAPGVVKDAVALATPIATVLTALDAYLTAMELAAASGMGAGGAGFTSAMEPIHGLLTTALAAAALATPSKSTISA